MELSNKKTNVSLFLATLVIVVVSDDTLWFGTNGNTLFINIKYCVLLACLALIFFSNMRIIDLSRVSSSAVLCGLMCALMLITGVFNSDLRTGYFYKCCLLILSCLFAKNFLFEEFARIFEKIMFFFATTSAFCTLLATVNISLVSGFPIFYNSAKSSFYNLIVCMINVSDKTVRNYGIFREPGVFQMFLMLGLLFYTYYAKEFKIYRFAVYVIAIGLTYSTTGYIALIVYLIVYFVKDTRGFSVKKKKLITIVLIAVALIFILVKTDLLSSDGVVFNKVGDMKRHTTVARLASVFANIEMWLRSPIFGNGLTYVGDNFPEISLMRYGYESPDNTNTLLCELATYGLLYTVIFVMGYVRFIKKITEKKVEQVLIGIVLVVLSCGEKLTFSPIIYILLFYGFSRKNDFYERKLGVD